MTNLQVILSTQRIIVDPPTLAVSIVYAGPVGPPGPQGLAGVHAGSTPPPDTTILWYQTQ
jgi:hypothetical protein